MFAFDYNDLCLSTVFKGGRPAVQSGLITTEVIGGRSGVADTGDGPEDRKKSPKRSQMTSCDLIQFSITVSSNHRERRERMKGRQRRRWIDEGIFFFGGGGGVTTQHGRVWNAIKSGTEPQGVSPHSHVAANPTDALHLWEGWHVCIHVVYFILHAVWQQGLLITHTGCVRILLYSSLLPQHLQN